MDRTGVVTSSGLDVPDAKAFSVYSDATAKALPRLGKGGKGKQKSSIDEKENVAPHMALLGSLAHGGTGGGSFASKPSFPVASEGSQQRQPLRDVTHLYYPSAGTRPSSGAGNACKNGLRSMR